MEQKRRLPGRMLFCMFFLLLPAVLLINNCMLEKRAADYQQSLIGSLYQSHPELCREYLAEMFEAEMTETNMAAGQEAMIEYGYTVKGMEYLIARQNYASVYRMTGAAMALLLAAAAVLWVIGRKDEANRARQMEQQICQLQKQNQKNSYYEEQNKRLQSFIENIAHQIKTPISRVMSSLDLLNEETGGLSAGCGGVSRIEECFSHLESIRQLTNRLINIGRMEAGTVLFSHEPILLEELLYDSFSAAAGPDAGMNLKRQPDGEEMVYDGDYEWLKEAFINLFTNCTEHDQSGEAVEVRCKKEKEYYMIRIRDHGPGFQEADLPNLFNRFYLPRQVKTGHVGIGLNLVKLIIEGHRGTVHARNDEEKGAVFEIMLPRYELKEKR
ncbi:MAG: HAMP domain-containing histidine kinase [Lachnospiraceae bacterium]|nr:HAMP domain-containing histidine kinase [Lachnospiraceae bacterium]